MKIEKLVSRMHKAISTFNLIADGDKIAVGLSGGKDSRAMLKALSLYRHHSPQKFELIAITVDVFKALDKAELEAFCKSCEVELKVVESDIGEVVFDIRKEKNPCSLCAKMRRGALASTARELNCNKLALAHTADDILSTFMLSLNFENRLSTLSPKSYLSKTEITVIRPFIYVWEGEIKNLEPKLPVTKNPCPVDKKTERENAVKILKKFDEISPNFSKKLFTAIMSPERYNLIKNN